MKIKLNFFVFFLTGIISGSVFSETMEPSLCKTNETALFNCTTSREKIISLCESQIIQNKYIEYRHGNLKKIDFSYKIQKNSENKIYQGTFSGGNISTDMLWFNNGNYTYILFSPNTGPDGVAVTKNNMPISSQKCVMKSLGDLSKTNELFEKKSDEDARKMIKNTSE